MNKANTILAIKNAISNADIIIKNCKSEIKKGNPFYKFQAVIDASRKEKSGLKKKLKLAESICAYDFEEKYNQRRLKNG